VKGTSCALCCMFMFNELRFRSLARVLALSPSIGPAQSNPGRLFLGFFGGRRQLVVGLPAAASHPSGAAGAAANGSRAHLNSLAACALSPLLDICTIR
jgi:hypothetical protein